MTIKELRNSIEQLKGRKAQVERNITQTELRLGESKRLLRRHEQAREVVRDVGIKTQKQLEYHISNITSLALETVYDNPYELKAEFVQRRNQTECDLFFVRDGNRVDPIDAAGGGVVDVAAFALRVASWSMSKPHLNNVLILDEPFKHLKGQEANKRVLEMVREISNRLNLQIIMVSDERIDRDEIVASADRVFEVTIHEGVSKVEQILKGT